MKPESRSGHEIAISNANFIDAPTMYYLGYLVRDLLDTANCADYDGMEWHPIQGSVAGVQMKVGVLNDYEKNGIVSMHQSFRYPKNPLQVLQSGNVAFEAKSYVLYPQRTSSLRDMEHIQDVVGSKLPVVLYPSKFAGEKEPTNGTFSEKLFQPRPVVMRRFGTKTVSELMQVTRELGYTGVCVDFFHMRETDPDGYHLLPWQELLPQLLPFATEIHIAAGRIDQPNSGIDTMQELRDLLAGRGTSDLLKMIEMTRDYMRSTQRPLRFVVEIPARALHKLHETSGKTYPQSQFIADHARIVENIRTLLS